jgi:hypothetical protein
VSATAVVATVAGLAVGGAVSAAAAVPHNPLGRIDQVKVGPASVRAVAGVHLSGWGFDPDATASPVMVSVSVDKRLVVRAVARLVRYDVGTKYHVYHVGWAATVPVRSGRRWVCVSLANQGAGAATSLGCRLVSVAVSANQRIVAAAQRHLGQRYVAGAAGPTTFDCSGLVQYTYRQAGLRTPPRTTGEQYGAAHRITESRALPGDLVFYHSGGGVYHVAIYTGRHNTIVAANSRQGVIRERIWAAARVTFGSFTHR